MTEPTPTRPQPVPLDEIATYIDAYNQARAEAARWTDIADQARRVIEDRLGVNELGTIAGTPRVKWTTVTSTRLDTKAVKEKAPDVYAACTITGTTRRFTLLDGTP